MKLHNDRLIKKWEALRLRAYKPTINDVWTIGWGHTKGVHPGMVITEQEAERLFRSDVAWAVEAVNTLVKVPLTQNQFDALVSFVFNIGTTNFRKSTLLRKLNVRDYEGAANELPRWVKQKGVTLRGLVRRRAEEMEYFLSNISSEEEAVEVEAPAPLKKMSRSKEALGAVAALLTGASSFLGSMSPELQVGLARVLPVALVAFGIYFLVNRLVARRRAER